MSPEEMKAENEVLRREVERLLGELDGANDVWAESSARWTSDMGAVVAKLQAAEADAASLRALVPVWRGIESAPKDGTRILTWGCLHDDHGIDMGERPDHKVTWWWTEEGYPEGSWYSISSGSHEPTHWMPLPDAPKGGDA